MSCVPREHPGHLLTGAGVSPGASRVTTSLTQAPGAGMAGSGRGPLPLADSPHIWWWRNSVGQGGGREVSQARSSP